MSAQNLKEFSTYFIKEEDSTDFKIRKNEDFSFSIETEKIISAKEAGKIIYNIWNKLKVKLTELKFQFIINSEKIEISKKELISYFELIFSTPFLWKNKKNLFFFNEEKNIKILKGITLKQNLVFFTVLETNITENIKENFSSLKEILNKFGISNLNFLIKKEPTKFVEQKFERKKSIFQFKSERKTILKIPNEWKKRKIFELGVHTNYSTLDGISTPEAYIESAIKKNYKALAVTDHYNVQSFPSFENCSKEEIKIIYGCELEVLEENFPNFLLNQERSKLKEEIKNKKIGEIKYCVFDVETTGFFSEFNEIIEIGYVIIENEKIIKEAEYLVKNEIKLTEEAIKNWYNESIKIEELQKAPSLAEVLNLIKEDLEDCVLVAHNAAKFDYGFLNKGWKKVFREELCLPIIDTLVLSWILFPSKKSFSLEKLTQTTSKSKFIQEHRALSDSQSLTSLFLKMLKTFKEKGVNYWTEVKGLITESYFPNKGVKVKVLVKNQEGLSNLYRLITISHTKNLFRNPCVFFSDLKKYRNGLLIGSSSSRDGEVLQSFLNHQNEKEREEKIIFYDYIELPAPRNFSYLWDNGQISKEDFQNVVLSMAELAEKKSVITIASHNVHYCEKEEALLKQIIVANEGMNGSKHYLFNEATLNNKVDNFEKIPQQHLLKIEEILEQWSFFKNKEKIEEIIFTNQESILNKIEKVSIKREEINYSKSILAKKQENDLIEACKKKANKIFGKEWPSFVKERIKEEWKVIKGKYVFIYWLAWKIAEKTHQDGSIIGSRGSIGSSFFAFLCGITDLNPLPFYEYCSNCFYTEIYNIKEQTFSCYDYNDDKKCPNCSRKIDLQGHNLPFETFFGWEGEKTPDIDLNFSGDYQKEVHNYVRKLLGENSVHRIGTINTLSQQTAEIFWNEYYKLRKKFNDKLKENDLLTNWIDWEKIRKIQQKIISLRIRREELEKKLSMVRKTN